MRTKKLPTPKGYERMIAARYRKWGYRVIRADHTNYMPDYMVYNKGCWIQFVEVKRYLSCTSIKQVLSRIKRAQKKQSERLHELSYSAQVHLHIMLKGGVEGQVTLSGGRAYVWEQTS